MTGKFLDIFSKKTKKPKPLEEKIKIIADYREKNSLVIPELISQEIDVEIKELKVADYIVKETAVERKTISDFISSMTNKRLFRQLEELQQYKNKILIIEGTEEQELYNDRKEGFNGNAIRGFLLSIILKFKVPIIFTKNPIDTAKFLIVLAKKQKKESSLNPKKRNLSQKEQMQYILESFPNIGPKTAKKLLDKYRTLKNIFNTPLEELKKDIGKKAETFELLSLKYKI